MLATEEMETASPNQAEAVEYRMVHRTDRRIRVQIPSLSDLAYGNRLKQQIEQINGVLEVHLNDAARSIAVEFAPQSISPTLIHEKVLSCIQSARISAVLDSPETAQADNFANEMAASKLPQTVGYQVLHRNQRYLRIQIPRLTDDQEYAQKLHYLVESLDSVNSVRLNSITKTIAVEFDYTVDQQTIERTEQRLLAAIQSAAHLDLATALATGSIPEASPAEINYWERLGLPALSLGLGLAALVGLPVPGGVVSSIIFAAAIPIFQRALEGIQQDRELTIDFLDGLAISLHTLQGSYFAPALMLGLVEGGEVIRDMTARGSERASLDLLDCLGKYAFVERDGQEVQVAVKDLVEGDRVVVYPGDQVPVDGFILRGTGLLDQCNLTGESIPVTRTVGDEVFASTLLVEGHLCILVERTGNNTRAGVIVSLMQSAPVHDTRTENYAAAIANQMVVPTLFAAASVGLFSGDLNRAIALLTLDLGTGIRVSVPTTILSALTDAARNGVFIRSGRAIELLAKVDTIVFDKTGTLTQGHAGVTGIKVFQPNLSETGLLALAATAEQGLTHPVAEAIVRHARDLGVPLYSCDAWDYRVGLGVVATIQDQQILVGSQRLMLKETISLEPLYQHDPHIQSGSHSVVYIAADGQLVGVILYSDPPRPESKDVVRALQQQGINPYMLSGDVTRVAEAVAAELGMDATHIYAEAFPERKVEVVRELHDQGKTVAFCGDGINDSAALAYADVSISFAGATDIARETADVVLMENDLRGLVHAIKVAKQAMEIIWQNISIVAVPNVGAVVAGVLFALDPILAIVINNGSAILAELNGLRPLLGVGETAFLRPSLDAAALAEGADRLSETVSLTQEEAVISQASSSIVHRAESVNTKECRPASDLLQSQIIPSLKQADLAKRLGITSQILTRRRSKAGFIEWSQSKDPEHIGWQYEFESKLFHAMKEQRSELPV